jgi:hypothetical protein
MTVALHFVAHFSPSKTSQPVAPQVLSQQAGLMSHKWLEIQDCKMLSTSNKTCQLAALTSKLPCSDLAAQHILVVFMVVLLLRFGSGLWLCSSVVLIVVVPCGCVPCGCVPCGCVPCDCDRDCRHGPLVVNVVVVFLLMVLGLTLYRSVLWWLL